MGAFKVLLQLMAIVLWVSACEPSRPVSFAGPDGATVQKVKCKGEQGQCFSQASEMCGRGSYQVVDSESHAGGWLADVFPGPVTWYSLTFQCGPSDGRMPDFPFEGPEYVAPDVVAVGPIYTPPVYGAPVHTSCSTMGAYTNCTSY